MARNLEEAVKRIFGKVIVLHKLPNDEAIGKMGLDALLTVRLDSSKLELLVEESVWRAIGKHYLSVCVSLSDRNLHILFEDRFVAEGKSLDLIDFETEGGWWKTAGPKYGPAVENSIEHITSQLAESLSFFGTKMVNR